MAYYVPEPISLAIPSSIFKNRNLSVLEAMVVHLKEEKKMTYAQIGRLLNRNDRTIWTAYNRASKKIETNENKTNEIKRKMGRSRGKSKQIKSKR